MKFVTKKTLRTQNAAYAEHVRTLTEINKTIVKYNEELADKVEELLNMYPFNVDDVVYELILKNDKGRFTKKSPSIEHSAIVETTVTKRNYFTLMEKYKNCLAFTDENEATSYLNKICN